MKKTLFIAATVLVSFLMACQREAAPVTENNSENLIQKTFSVSLSDTKTYLDAKTVKWSDTDVINVIGVTAGGTVYQHDFTISSGQNTSSATFSGTVNADEETFYAIYPNYAIDATKIADGIILMSANMPKNGSNMEQRGYVDGIDPRVGVMVAVADASDNFAFEHLVSYFKFKIGVEDVTKVTFSTTGDLRFGARIQYTIGTKAIETQSAVKVVELTPATGTTFVKDSYYYIAFPTRTSKKIKQLTVAYTIGGSDYSLDVNDSNFKNLVPEPGKIYNIGCPPIVAITTPTLNLLKTTETGVPAAAATGLTIADAYSLLNCVDTDVTVTYDGTVITGASISGGTVTYSISENTGDAARDGWIGLNLAGETVQTITVTQMKPAAAGLVPITTTKTWNVANNFAPLATSMGTSALSVTFIDDNLQYVCGGKIKFNSAYLRFDGTGSATDKCVQFKIAGPGTLTVNAKSANSTATDRSVKIALNGTVNSDVFTVPKGSDSAEDHTWTITSASSGDQIAVFSGNSGINVYSITWTPD